MKYFGSTKKNVQFLVNACHQKGIKHVVLSPGSRNAPLIISFTHHPAFTCYSVTDERCAGFYALGMARQLQEPVVVVCTSGTAVLNLAPSVAEAYYQEIPLVIITADRPADLIDREDGQTIRQPNIFKNYCSANLNLTIDNFSDIETSVLLDHVFSLNLCFPGGPIHINVPLEEPLYETQEITQPDNFPTFKNQLPHREILFPEWQKEWESAHLILFVCGVALPGSRWLTKLNTLSEILQIPLIASAHSNIEGKHCVYPTDKTLTNLTPDDFTLLKPDLLITFGGPVVSKKVREFLRQVKPRAHWDIDASSKKIDTYGCLTRQITIDTEQFTDALEKMATPKDETYANQWLERFEQVKQFQMQFTNRMPWSDFAVYHNLLQKINHPVQLHAGNSTPVRYLEFFAKHPNVSYYSNRGTSGIDGSTSTAIGSALVSDKQTLLITGDVAFIYDSNAFWYQPLPKNLRVLVINNQGGNIFRLIPGPSGSYSLPYFETPHRVSIQKLCESYGVKHLKASSLEEYQQLLPEFLHPQAPATVFEVVTPPDISAKVYKHYLTCPIEVLPFENQKM